MSGDQISETHSAAPSVPRGVRLRGRLGSTALRAALAWVLMLTAPACAGAVSAGQSQGIGGEVQTQVSWGSAKGCAQNIQTNDFGALTPYAGSAELGAFDATPHAAASTDTTGHKVWVGCVTANAPLASIVAQGATNMTNGAADVLALSNVAIGVTNAAANGSSTACAVNAGQSQAGTCTLPVDGSTVRSLVGEVPAGTTEVDWQYQLSLPANQAVGSYTGGQVVLTASVSSSEAAARPAVLTAPSLSSTSPVEGDSISVSTGSWSGSPTSYSYQWQDCESAGANCSNIAGATSSAYLVGSADVGRYLRAIVTASNSAGSSSSSATATAASLSLYNSTIKSDNAIALYPLGDTGATALDVIGGQNGSYAGTYSQVSSGSGPFTGAGAIHFSSSAKMTSPHLGVAGSAWTLEAWVKPDTGASTGAAMWAGDGTTTGYAQDAITAGASACGSWWGGINAYSSCFGSPLQWQLIDLVHGSDGVSRLYVDGVQHATDTQATSGSNWSLSLAMRGCCSDAPFVGSISEAAIYNYGLSAEQVLRHYQEPGNIAAPVVVSPLTVSGETQTTAIFSVSSAVWQNSPTQISYQWQDCDAAGENCTNISGATSTTYRAVPADAGHTLRVLSTATNAKGSTSTSALVPGGVFPSSGFPAYESTVLSQSPIYYFPFNETNVVCESTHFTNLGTQGGIADCNTYWGSVTTPGGSNGPMLNNNATVEGGGYVQELTSPSVSGSFTIEEFVDVTNSTTISNGVKILGSRWRNDYSFDLGIKTTGLSGDIGNGSSWITNGMNVAYAFAAHHWYQVVETISNAGGKVTWTYYVNGSLAGSGNVTSSAVPLLMGPNDTHTLFMDTSGANADQKTFQGKVSDVAVYTRALSAAEVQAQWNAVGTVQNNA